MGKGCAASRQEGRHFRLEEEVNGGALCTLRCTLAQGRRQGGGEVAFSSWEGEGAYCTWALQNVEKDVFEEISI